MEWEREGYNAHEIKHTQALSLSPSLSLSLSNTHSFRLFPHYQEGFLCFP